MWLLPLQNIWSPVWFSKNAKTGWPRKNEMRSHTGLSNDNWQDTPTDYSLCPATGEFLNTELERHFQTYHLARTQSQLRLTLSFCATFYVLFALTDFAILGTTYGAFVLLSARLFVAVSAAICLFLLKRYPHSIDLPRQVASMIDIIGMGAFQIIVLYRPHEIPWHSMSMSIMLIVVYLFIPNTFLNSITVALATTFSFCLLSVGIGHMNLSDILTMAMLLVFANGVGIVAARRYHRMWRHEFSSQSILKDISVRDPLTGCYNRRHLQDYLLEREFERACRYPSWLTVLICDLDHFKNVNDLHGHLVGDAALHNFAGLLKTMCREHVDSVIRFGGEEFLLLLPETDLAGGAGLAERLRVMLAERPIYSDKTKELELLITASFGVVSVNFATEGHGVSPQTLIAEADRLLYHAKKSGRNRVEAAEYTRQPLVALNGGITHVPLREAFAD